MTAHPDCGETVFLVDGEPFDVDGGEHLCRDYVAWHQVPDRRHPAGLDVADGWKPRVPVGRRVGVAA